MKNLSKWRVALTITFLLGLLLMVSLRNNQWRLPSFSALLPVNNDSATAPESAVYSMLDAARAGDTRAYLQAFYGPIRDQLAQVVRDESEAKFANYLLEQNAGFQGVAITVVDRASATEAQARVEYIYSNRNEMQDVFVRREGGKWKIIRVAGSEQIKTLIPFGTAVAE